VFIVENSEGEARSGPVWDGRMGTEGLFVVRTDGAVQSRGVMAEHLVGHSVSAPLDCRCLLRPATIQ